MIESATEIGDEGTAPAAALLEAPATGGGAAALTEDAATSHGGPAPAAVEGLVPVTADPAAAAGPAGGAVAVEAKAETAVSARAVKKRENGIGIEDGRKRRRRVMQNPRRRKNKGTWGTSKPD